MHIGARAHSVDDIGFVAEAGFGFAEIDWKEPALLRTQLARLASLRSKHGIAYLAHGPREGNPFDVERLEGVLGPAVCQLLDLAPTLGLTLYTQHLWLDPRFVNAQVIARKLDLLETWAERAAHVGVTFCIENLSEHADHFAPAFARIPGLYMTLDLGHAEILSQTNASFDFIARYPERIRHVHLHDNNGGNKVVDDLHLPIGEGSIDFAGILRSLWATGYDRGLCLEIGLAHLERSRAAIRTLHRSPTLGTQSST